MKSLQRKIGDAYLTVSRIEDELYDKKRFLAMETFFFNLTYKNGTADREIDLLDPSFISDIFTKHIHSIFSYFDKQYSKGMNYIVKDNNPYLMHIKNIPTIYITSDPRTKCKIGGLLDLYSEFLKETKLFLSFDNSFHATHVKLLCNMFPLRTPIDIKIDYNRRLIGLPLKNNDT